MGQRYWLAIRTMGMRSSRGLAETGAKRTSPSISDASARSRAATSTRRALAWGTGTAVARATRLIRGIQPDYRYRGRQPWSIRKNEPSLVARGGFARVPLV